jgi:glutaredoxin-like protein
VAALQALGYIRERRVPAPEEPPALKTEDREALARILRDRLQRPVRLIHFTQVPGSDGSPVGPECGTCRETRRLLEEFSALSPSLTLEIHDLARDAELAERLGVARIPATLVGLDEEDSPRHRFYGQPSGYEFGPFLDCVLETSARMVRVEESTATALRGLSRPVRVEVLTTPTCPRCPEAARLAQRFAAGSPDVVADVVAVTEFPEVAQLYRVQAVPLVVVDGRPAPPGPLGEASLLALVLAAGSRAAADAPATVEAHADAADHRSVGE